MSRFVEILKRLYDAERINVEKLNELKIAKRITQLDYDYICLIEG